ncbi:hypothetical protein Psch_02198 [Pelotomaculum schinkii]|uniref:Uncharacterized protein n=1 Tax=Pelotomaculum schinkii TaxID=78350 RepID=A0A4Y7RIU7_9FIRM|nr:hypothetical protein [Pelotomaculum schinkii]TEB08632.1 hypothetical protein Psch_02198 [Pelotomaculum schinkii]
MPKRAMDDIINEIRENKKKVDAELSIIREEQDLSEAGRAKWAAKAWGKAMAKHRKLVAELNATREETRTALRKAAFSPRIGYTATVGDKAAIRQAFNTAMFSLQEADSKGLMRALERAQRTGDDLYALAVANIAAEKGDSKVLQRYRELAGSERAEDMDKLVEFEKTFGDSRDTSTKFAEKIIISAPSQPKEISMYSEAWEIANAAMDGAEV